MRTFREFGGYELLQTNDKYVCVCMWKVFPQIREYRWIFANKTHKCSFIFFVTSYIRTNILYLIAKTGTFGNVSGCSWLWDLRNIFFDHTTKLFIQCRHERKIATKNRMKISIKTMSKSKIIKFWRKVPYANTNITWFIRLKYQQCLFAFNFTHSYRKTVIVYST